MRNVLLLSVVECDSMLCVLVGEEKGSIVLLNNVAGAAPAQVEVNDAETGVLGSSDFVKVLWRFDFENDLLLDLWWHFLKIIN